MADQYKAIDSRFMDTPERSISKPSFGIINSNETDPIISKALASPSGKGESTLKAYLKDNIIILQYERLMMRSGKVDLQQIEIPKQSLPFVIENLEQYIKPESKDLLWHHENKLFGKMPTFDQENVKTEITGSGFDMQFYSRSSLGSEYKACIINNSREGYMNNDAEIPSKQPYQIVKIGLKQCESLVLPQLKNLYNHLIENNLLN